MDIADHAAAIVHDVKNRLQLLNLKTESLRESPSPVVQQMGADIEQGLSEVNHQLVLLLSLYRLDESEVITIQETYLSDMLASISARVPNCEVLCDENLSAFVDERLVTAVIGDAVHNASRYGKGRIRLTAVQADQGVCISVEDDGTGMGEAVPENSGLGLLLAEKVAKAHRNGSKTGQINLGTSEGLGGTRFDFFVP